MYGLTEMPMCYIEEELRASYTGIPDVIPRFGECNPTYLTVLGIPSTYGHA